MVPLLFILQYMSFRKIIELFLSMYSFQQFAHIKWGVPLIFIFLVFPKVLMVPLLFMPKVFFYFKF